MSLLPLPQTLVPFLDPYLPRPKDLTFVTLTYAQSLDSKIAALPGTQTKISHLETKTMTHYLRSKHDAIFVAIGTVLADDPKLNCRYPSGQSPIPVILDPKCQWNYSDSQLRTICDEKSGKPPYILIDESVNPRECDLKVLENQGGKYISLPLLLNRGQNWQLILQELYKQGIKSVMIEGGASVINDLLMTNLIDSLIITIGPVFLGQHGVDVSPPSAVNLRDVQWWTGVQDSVLASKIKGFD